MKRTQANRHIYNQRLQDALRQTQKEAGGYTSRGVEAIAQFKVQYPHLMKRVKTTASGDLPRGMGGYTIPTTMGNVSHAELRSVDKLKKGMQRRIKTLSKKDSERFGRASLDWLKAKSKPAVVVRHANQGRKFEKTMGGPERAATFVLAHEMRHAADALRRSNRSNLLRGIGNRFIPYNLRPQEWRANIAGVKKVVKEYNVSAKEARAIKMGIHGTNAFRAAKQVGWRGLPVVAVAAAIHYRKKKKKQAQQAA